MHGSIRDAQQVAITDVALTLQAETSAPPLTAHTDAQGRYRFPAVAPGSYRLHAESAKAGVAAYGPLLLHEGEERTLDLTLTAASSSSAAAFSDEPTFTVAGVSESSGAGGHGSDAVRRKADDLTKATASLGSESFNGATLPSGSSATPTDYEQRAAQLRQSIAQQDRADLHHQLAAVEEQAGHPLDAVHEYQRAAEMDPSERNLFDWGAELLVHRATEPAIDVFGKGNRLFPGSARMLTGLAVAEFARGSYEQAAARLCQASDLNPDDPTPYLFLGQMQSAHPSLPASAVALLARFAQRQPRNALANYYYAVALWNRRASDDDARTVTEVKRLLLTAITLDPKLAPAYLQLGILDSARGQWSEAADAYRQAIAADPTLEEAHYRLGQAYRRAGDKVRADEQFALYQQLAQSADERANREHKAVLQFIFELKTPGTSAEAH